MCQRISMFQPILGGLSLFEQAKACDFYKFVSVVRSRYAGILGLKVKFLPIFGSLQQIDRAMLGLLTMMDW